jgi:hypothetical protein
VCQALKARSLVKPNHHSFRYVPLLQYEDVSGQYLFAHNVSSLIE